MNSGILQVFQRELICPICMNYFIDPVTIDCGHSFCRPCFCLNWQDMAVLAQCSKCKKTTRQRNLKTNICLKNMASIARKASLRQFLSSEEQICGMHRETKEMFCEVDKSLLCLLCSNSQEHRSHRHCPTEWAAEERREELLKKMQSLWEKACENLRNLNMATNRIRCWKSFGDILHRYESVLLQVSEPVNPEFSAGPIIGLMDRLKGFRVYLTLQHARASSHIFLHGDLRSMKVGCDPQDDPNITDKSECFLQWGADFFRSGKFYWEFNMGHSWNWAFGVCNNYWKEKRQNDMIDGEVGLFLLGCVKEDTHCSLFTTSPLVVQYVPRPTDTVGLFLDCEGRTVSFVDVDRSSLIYTIPNCSFSPPLWPVICCSHF
ncbi:putative tripartite motif-containing protein 51G isoform X2 [Pan paniscus]|uniref:putative tripartite motif-containing protein 51G isoform X2 n=1 Tax=Pan paniscus TaxID=9597 RepID=UPI00155FC963|nr:putative tripartite motif-containing protein 51G isoform X2 [Pan paniscus]